MGSPKSHLHLQIPKLWRHQPIGNRFPVYDDAVMSELVNLKGMNLTRSILESITLTESISVSIV